jgi:outer membrane protein OmpA-like peptidoglycan-associated protein
MRRIILVGVLASLGACVARPTVPPAVPVFFRNASVTLDPNGQRDVARAATLARQYANARIKLVGYSLPVNAPAEPIRLSQQRTDTVKAELVRDGVAVQRIEVYNGGAVPDAKDSPVESRRVDISFLP